MEIIQEGVGRLGEYQSVPIRFEVSSRLVLSRLSVGELVEVICVPRVKDYDLIENELPLALALRYDLTNWGIFAAFIDGRRAGGAIVAPPRSGYTLNESQEEASVIVDLRIHPDFRGKGIGKALISAGLEWVRSIGGFKVLVETQDTNVPACRLYAGLGFRIESIELDGYGVGIDEARLVWGAWARG